MHEWVGDDEIIVAVHNTRNYIRISKSACAFNIYINYRNYIYYDINKAAASLRPISTWMMR